MIKAFGIFEGLLFCVQNLKVKTLLSDTRICVVWAVSLLMVKFEGVIIMFNNKLFISYGGIVAILPAKPILVLATIGTATICAAGYWLFIEEDED